MVLQLFRRYEETRTLGLLKMYGKVISKTLENPRLATTPCMDEGKYELLLRYNEQRGWYLQVDCLETNAYTVEPLHQGNKVSDYSIVPVLYWNNREKFSKLATLKLMDKLETIYASGDRIWLEISDSSQNILGNDGLAD
ncbi:MAG: DUF5675 family protein [Mongoliitalea sp.]